MTDNIGEHMTDEELHAAQPDSSFKFMLTDRQLKLLPREVTVANWIAKDGHWGDVYNALMAAADGNMATATEKIAKALERARQFGYQQAVDEQQRQFKEMRITSNPNLGPDEARSYGGCGKEYVARPLTEEAKRRHEEDSSGSFIQ